MEQEGLLGGRASVICDIVIALVRACTIAIVMPRRRIVLLSLVVLILIVPVAAAAAAATAASTAPSRRAIVIIADLRALQEETALVLLELTIVHSLATDWTPDWPASALALLVVLTMADATLTIDDLLVICDVVFALVEHHVVILGAAIAQRCASIAVYERGQLTQIVNGLARARLLESCRIL